MIYLVNTVEDWRADKESEAQALIEKAKAEGNVIKYSSAYKETKVKGEVVDEYYKVTITRALDNIKEPLCHFTVNYSEEGAF